MSCVIGEDDHGLLKATPMIHTDDSRPSDFTFAHMAMQTDDQDDDDTPLDVAEELRTTIGCHLWLVQSLQACFGSLLSLDIQTVCTGICAKVKSLGVNHLCVSWGLPLEIPACLDQYIE